MTEAEKVAAGLTKAQRRAVLAARHFDHRHAYLPEGYYVDADRRVCWNLAVRGVLRDYLNSHQRLTPLGLAVRAILEKPADLHLKMIGLAETLRTRI